MIGAHVRTPKDIWPLVSHLKDLCPYAGDGLAIPDFELKEGEGGYWNGDYSRLAESLPHLFRLHTEGHFIALLTPIADNSETRALIRYGVLRLIPDQRLFPEVRGVELVILTGRGRRFPKDLELYRG